jgi:hypothetical protein
MRCGSRLPKRCLYLWGAITQISFTKALVAAFDYESEADIAVAIDEAFSLAIETRLRQLDEPSCLDD